MTGMHACVCGRSKFCTCWVRKDGSVLIGRELYPFRDVSERFGAICWIGLT